LHRKDIRAGIEKVQGIGIKAFSRDEMTLIHSSTMEVLKDIGIKVESQEAIEIFHSSGAKIEGAGESAIVKIPPYIVEDCIRWAPSNIVLYGRDPKDDYVIGPGRVGFTLFGENIKVNDLYTRENRECNKNDLGGATKVADALEEIGIVEKCMGSRDKNPATQSLHNYEAMVTNTSKHISHGFFSANNSRKIVEMAAACVGGMETFKKRPCVTCVVCPTSPLMLVKDCCETIIESSRLGVGLCSISMPLSGATSTCTLAGTLVIQNAELLASLVLSQLTSRGTPFIYGSCATIMDLKVINPALGAPEHGMLSIGTAKMAQFYNIPSWCGSGTSNSKLPDEQSASEFAMNTTLTALAGANIIFGCGSIESGLTFDFAKLVMDTEHVNRLQMALKGIDVNDEDIAMEVIKDVGPGGEFLTHPHTMKEMRKMSEPGLFDRAERETWMEQKGGRSLAERAYEKARYIYEKHEPIALPKGASKIMKSIIEEYEKEINASGQ